MKEFDTNIRFKNSLRIMWKNVRIGLAMRNVLSCNISSLNLIQNLIIYIFFI